ncbi:hypothetical protein Sste5344_004508 [Sporothrix stenoceras]
MTNAPAYDRDRVVAAVREFYAFLTRIPRWTAGDFQDAPSCGWPELTDEVLSPLGKDETVRDLLRHLPYLMPSRDSEANADDGKNQDHLWGAGTCGDKSMIAPETHTNDYPNTQTLHMLARPGMKGLFEPAGAGVLPPHVAVLTTGSRYGSWLLVDTQLGTATDFIMMERPERDIPAQGSDDYWRAYRTLPVEEMLEEWKAKFIQLEWVVVPDNHMDGVMYWMDARTDRTLEAM